MKRLHTRVITAAVLASSLLLGACSGGEGEESDATSETSSSTVTSTTGEASSEESSSAETSAAESAADEEPDAADAESDAGNSQDNAADGQAAAPAAQQNQNDADQAAAPAAQQNQNDADQAAAPAPEQNGGQNQAQGPADRQSVIDGMAATAAASGEDISGVPPAALNQIYGCVADSLISQDANSLTTAIANQQNRDLTAEESGQMETAYQTCVSQLADQLGG